MLSRVPSPLRGRFLVHSRTFGFDAPEGGGEPFRIMAPVADMLNHAGDRSTPLFSGPGAVSLDHLSWRLVGPMYSASGGWEFEMRANRPIQVRSGAPHSAWVMLPRTPAAPAKEEAAHRRTCAPLSPVPEQEGEEVFLSYGKRSNDDFVLQYGFLPLGNPWDDYELFGDLDGALDWCARVFGAAVPADLLGAARSAAVEAASAVERQLAAADEGQSSGPGAGPVPGTSGRGSGAFEGGRELKALPGGRLDNRLQAAMRAMWQTALGGALTEAQAGRLADVAIVLRCAELLGGSDLVADLQRLVRGSGAMPGSDFRGDEETKYYME